MQTHRAALCLLIATCLAGCESPAPSHSHLLNALVDLHTHQLDAAKIELARADPGDPAVQHMWGAYYNNHAVFLCRHAQEDKALQEFKRAGQLNPDLKQVVQHNKQHCPLNRRI